MSYGLDEKLERAIAHYVENIAREITIDDITLCPICKDIPEKSNSWRYVGEEWKVELPVATSLLKKFIEFGRSEPIASSESYYILRCPECGRLYTHEYSYDFAGGVGRSDEDIDINRKSLDDIIQIVINHVDGKENWWYYDLKGKLKKGKGLN